MPGLWQDDLRLIRLAVAAAIVSLPSPAPPGQTPSLTPPALSPEDAAKIYTAVARYGFSNFQMIPGGVRMISDGNLTQLTVTGTGWSFAEDLSRSVFEHARDKLGVIIGQLKEILPSQSLMLNLVVDLHALWSNIGEQADIYIANRFLKPEAERLANSLPALQYNGGAIRLNLVRESTLELPPGVTLSATGSPKDSVDVRIEPLYQDKSQLFIQVAGTFVPTNQFERVVEQVDFVRDLLWKHVARSLTFDEGE
jgi:hypothetical protein